MIQLFLDGMVAIPSDKATIKLTAENPYFTKSATYTYEVELPLAITENRNIFGNIDRMDVSKQGRTLSARLIVDNMEVLTGNAHITSVSESAVKVQLLGASAAYNKANKLDDIYIDELDLGNWFMNTWPDGSMYNWLSGYYDSYPDRVLTGNTHQILLRSLDEHYKFGVLRFFNFDKDGLLTQIYNFFSGKYPWTTYPVYNSGADTLCNFPKFKQFTKDTGDFTLSIGQRADDTLEDGTAKPLYPTTLCIQPHIWYMAELIARATGFNLNKNNNALYTNSFLRSIIIVNAGNEILCNKCLPHWSINEWWENIENAFGVTIDVDYKTSQIRIETRYNHYTESAGQLVIDNVVDEYEVSMDDDTQYDVSSTNVGFESFECSPFDILDDSILENAKLNDEHDNLENLVAWGKSIGTDALKRYKDTIFRCKDGRQYIYTENGRYIREAPEYVCPGFLQVNMLRPRLVDESKKDIDVSLKFVPAQMTDAEAKYYLSLTNLSRDPDGTFNTQVLQVPGRAELCENFYDSYVDGMSHQYPEYSDELANENIDIENILNEVDEIEETESNGDIIYIAISKGLQFTSYPTIVNLESKKNQLVMMPVPVAQITEQWFGPVTDTATRNLYPGDSLSLIPIEGVNNLARPSGTNGVVIDSKTRYCIKFIYDSMPDPGAIFMIRNRRFVCEKIEADISSNSLNKLITGYFFELKL